MKFDCLNRRSPPPLPDGRGSELDVRNTTAVHWYIHDLKPRFAQYGAFGLLAAVLLAYSQTRAFHWDEGFHLLAARLIGAGQRPYLDFIFAQTPLNAYWTAAWFGVFGASWRLAHVVATLSTLGSAALLARYLWMRFPVPEWRPYATLTAAALYGLLTYTVDFGTIAQAYGFCLLMVVAAFCAAVAARERPGLWMPALAGALAGAAASASLLTVAAAPAMLVWLWLYNAAGRRWAKAAAFLGGAVVPAIPVLRLLAQGPRQVWFDLVQYHALYRRVDWAGATIHDIDVLSSWLQDTQVFLLIGLAVAGWMSIRKSDWAGMRMESRLCLWLVLAMGAQNMTAHPTFPQYFIFLVPFLAVPAVEGFRAAVLRLGFGGRPQRAVLALGCFMLLSLGRGLFTERDNETWHGLMPAAEKINQVAPRDAPVLAQEPLYILTGRRPPDGMEFTFAHKLDLGPKQNALLHILPQAELDREMKAGRFAAAAVCDDDDQESNIEDSKVYSRKFESGNCTVFWQLAAAGAAKPPMVK